MKNFPTESNLRENAGSMTLAEMKNLRDQLEKNWTNELRGLMQILSMACINKFNVTLSSI